jgi:uncharacterized membrane protein
LPKLEEAKTLGGIGSVLLLIPGVSIVGYILVLVAGKYVSDELNDRSIFEDMLYAVITGIVGVAIFAAVLFTGAAFGIFTLGLSSMLGVVAGLVVLWVFLIISAIFIRRAFNTIATRLNINSFRTAATLYFVGALLTIALVGFVILFVAYIFQVIAFFSIQGVPQPVQLQPSAAPVAQVGMKFCPSCGTQLDPSVAFCPKCGAKQSA